MDYRETGLKALEAVGGKGNVNNVTHCATRLRFELKDRSAVDEKKLAEVPGVMKTIDSAGQLQLVIGPSVNESYQAVLEAMGAGGFNAVGADGPSDKKKENDNSSFVQKFLGIVTGNFYPGAALAVASGMVRALLTILNAAGWVDTTSGVYTIITFAADSVFYFLPMILAYSSSKVFGMSTGLAMMRGRAAASHLYRDCQCRNGSGYLWHSGTPGLL